MPRRAALALLAAAACARPAAPPPAPPAAPVLGGTGWRLVRVRGADGAVRTPDDPARYTVGFAADGALFARLDCNRGRGTWASAAPGRLAFGPLALTRAMCPPGSLAPQLGRDWASVASYAVRDNRLVLSLAAGGAYEWEPDSTALPAPR